MSDMGDRWEMGMGIVIGVRYGGVWEDITMRYGCWVGNDVGVGLDMVGGGECVLVVGDKIE